MQIGTPYLVFLGDAKDPLAAKTGQGIVHWRPQWCLGQLRLDGCRADLGIADLAPREAVAAGAKTLVIGTVSPGGALSARWVPTLIAALDAGLDIASGMHARLDAIPEVSAAAERNARRLIEVRHSEQTFAVGSGRLRSGLRLLTVGTDCAVGKKYTALALEREMLLRGLNAQFRATGQTGILIAGSGVAIDAVVADFISGAAESLSPPAAADHWDIVEGQGSLLHPSFAGVSAGLLHGSQPDAFVVCHEPTRTTMRNVATPIATIADTIEQTIAVGRLTNPGIRCTGIAINTEKLEEQAAAQMLEETRERFDLPACDPLRFGVAEIVDLLAAEYPV